MSISGRFPSYDVVIEHAFTAIRRFPFALLSAAVGTVMALVLISEPSDATQYLLQRILVTAALGLPLFIALATFGEMRGWKPLQSIGLQTIAVLGLVGYFLSLPVNLDTYYAPLIRTALLAIAFHFLVAFLPYLQAGQMNGFWQYNKSLFLRFLLSALYSAVLYIGLTLALAAADYLFGADVSPKSYFRLWVVVVGVFNTWLFLAGVPRDLKALCEVGSYPKGLKVFTQFILLPLVGLYFVILFSYELKIIFQWNWPKGWVSNMVLWYSVVGILSMLLLYPLRELTENKWIQVFIRWFFRALVPLVVMLFLAISVRISDYGITENRYFVLVMAIGLALVMLYFIFSKSRDIRIIPIVICVIALVSSVGPWGAFSMSERSQLTRLEQYLTASGWSAKQSAESVVELEITPEVRREMSSIVSYLNEFHGLEPFHRFLPDSTIAVLDTQGRYDRASAIAERLGFTYSWNASVWNRGRTYFSIDAEQSSPLPITGYDFILPIDQSGRSDKSVKLLFGDDSLGITLDSSTASLNISFIRPNADTSSLSFNLADTLLGLGDVSRNNTYPQSQLLFLSGSDDREVMLVLQRIRGYRTDSTVEITALTGQLLLKRY